MGQSGSTLLTPATPSLLTPATPFRPGLIVYCICTWSQRCQNEFGKLSDKPLDEADCLIHAMQPEIESCSD